MKGHKRTKDLRAVEGYAEQRVRKVVCIIVYAYTPTNSHRALLANSDLTATTILAIEPHTLQEFTAKQYDKIVRRQGSREDVTFVIAGERSHMQVVDPFQAGNEILFENSKRVMSSVVPLFVAEGRRIALNGSGIYVCIEDRLFLFTAAHIVGASRALITALEPDRVGSLPAKGYYFYRDWADIAITELSETLTQYEPLRATDVQDYGRMPKRMPLCAIGFPASKARIYSSIADCTISAAISQEEDEEHYSKVGADPGRQIVVTYSKTSMRHLSGQISAAPDVYGMSGGGLFWIHDVGRLGPAIPKLVGILTRWDEVSLATIVATKTTVLDALLKESHGLRLF